MLMCRVSFPDKEVFERVLPVLNVALASLHPLTDEQMFRALNAGSVRGELEWKDFQQRLDSLAGFMVRLFICVHGREQDDQSFSFKCLSVTLTSTWLDNKADRLCVLIVFSHFKNFSVSFYGACR